MSNLPQLIQYIPEIEAALGYTFQDKNLIIMAFIHRSYANENRQVEISNERLEFLGDSVLGVLIAEYLYRNLPDVPEGELSSLRSRLVDAVSCVKYVLKLDLHKHVLLSRGECLNGGRGRDSILADLFEAIIGAIYLDGGFGAAQNFLFSHFKADIDAFRATPIQNYKALLQDYCQKNYQHTPVYKLLEEKGPDHIKLFKLSVLIENKEIGYGEGSSKKEAQQAAAADALSKINFKI